VPTVLPHLEPRLAALMQDELQYQLHVAESPAYATLPCGAIHGDLFRDNVMFEGKLLAGVFDFYFAGVDCLLFDIAVALNDWCIDLESGRLAEDRAEALVEAYESVRPLESAEIWLSRLWDVHLPRDAKLLKAHDPTHFERVLLQRRGTPWHPARHRPVAP
jgi:homoserine kinase type II